MKKFRKKKKTRTVYRNFRVECLRVNFIIGTKKKKKRADVEVDSLATLSYKIWNATLQSPN